MGQKQEPAVMQAAMDMAADIYRIFKIIFT